MTAAWSVMSGKVRSVPKRTCPVLSTQTSSFWKPEIVTPMTKAPSGFSFRRVRWRPGPSCTACFPASWIKPASTSSETMRDTPMEDRPERLTISDREHFSVAIRRNTIPRWYRRREALPSEELLTMC